MLLCILVYFNVAVRLTVFPANSKIHPHSAGGRVLISGPGSDTRNSSQWLVLFLLPKTV